MSNPNFLTDFPALEISQQSIPRLSEVSGQPDLAPSIALHQLAHFAPCLDSGVDMRDAEFPLSNDETATYYDQLRVREHTAEYREATNRTAIIIGEGSLMAALRFIPEDTIILLDKSEAQCALMSEYVAALRRTETSIDWGWLLGLFDSSSDSFRQNFTLYAQTQVEEWWAKGYTHPISSKDHDAFTQARDSARRKAIIPWCGDITNEADMHLLGTALRTHDAHVTMLNLSNVLHHDKTFDDAALYADVLRQLPVTPQAPILTTSCHRVWDVQRAQLTNTAEATGPFFGLDNVSRAGNTKTQPCGSIVERKQARALSGKQLPPKLRQMIGQALAEIIMGEEDLKHRSDILAISELLFEPDGTPRKWSELSPEVQAFLGQHL